MTEYKWLLIGNALYEIIKALRFEMPWEEIVRYLKDNCDSSGISYNWSILSELDVTDGSDFKLIALSSEFPETDGTLGSASNTSGVIAIQSALSSSTTMTSSTTIPPPSSTPASSQTSTATMPTQPPSGPNVLSTGANAGIGTGCSVAGLFLILGSLSVSIRRRGCRPTKSGSDTGGPFEKSELEAKGAQKQAD